MSEPARPRIFLSLAILVGIVIWLPDARSPAFAGDSENRAASTCSRTSRMVLRACRNEVQDDFWIGLAICQNLSHHGDRAECRDDVVETRTEELDVCQEQLDARLDICDALGEAPYDPLIDPNDFVDPTDIGSRIAANPYFPLTPGITRIYEGGDEVITVSVTHETKEILGVLCAVIRDVVEEKGVVIEDTTDWYAQDVFGNVWYFGEISQELEDGELTSLDGSWKAGVNGAKPGIIMFLDPQVGTVYRQEYAIGEAEDMAEVLSRTGSAVTPAAECDEDCVVTKDFLPFEPDAIEHKYYAAGVGFIREIKPGTDETLELMEIQTD